MAAAKHKFRFGVQAGPLESGSAWKEAAKKAEDLGYSVLLMGDHMGRSPASLEGLLAAALATTNLRVGPQVLSNDFRNPSILAKEIATIDVLTDGRFELGIGTGWPKGSPSGEADARQAGITLDEPGPRVQKLRESIQILKSYFESEEPFDYKGKFYQVEGVMPFPRPVQKPHPPIMVAGAGPQILKLAAREADIVNLAPRPPIVGRTGAGSIGFGLTMSDSIGILREAAGDRFDDLELCVFANNPNDGNPSITDDPDPLIDKLAASLRTTREAVLEMPATMIGSEATLVDRLQQHREQYGISYRILPNYAMEAFAPIVRRLAGT